MVFTRILCALDFSTGPHVLRSAARIAAEHDAELILLHVWQAPPASFDLGVVGSAAAVQRSHDDAQGALEAAAEEVRRLEVRRLGARQVIPRLAHGVPWQEILAAARSEPRLDLIIVGTHDHGGVDRVLLGSTAARVVRHAAWPVLTARASGDPGRYRRVLCPVDPADPAPTTLALAAELVQPGTGTIDLLHVVGSEASASRPAELDRALDAAAYRLDGWADDLRRRAGVPVSLLTRAGSPASEILALLQVAPSFDLVVMGSHARSGLARLLLGSVAETVRRAASCPVLVARSQAAERPRPRRRLVGAGAAIPS